MNKTLMSWFFSGEQSERGGCGADVLEEPHPEIHAAPAALAPAASTVRRGQCQL